MCSGKGGECVPSKLDPSYSAPGVPYAGDEQGGAGPARNCSLAFLLGDTGREQVDDIACHHLTQVLLGGEWEESGRVEGMGVGL